MNHKRVITQIAGLALIVLLLVACGPPLPISTQVRTTRAVASTDDPLLSKSEREAATLSSLEQVDDYPLYTMRYYADYNQRAAAADRADGVWASHVETLQEPVGERMTVGEPVPSWACSLFAALGDAENMLYGRNFDWRFSPALLLFTDPPDGYASVSMVDIAYLGFEGARAGTLTELSLAERQSLLDSPFWPFDGMNERGLVVGMAAVPESEVPYDLGKEAIDSLVVMREMLDHAGNVDQAVAILQSYNVEWDGGPALHYLIADSSGRSVLVEFYEGELVLIPGEAPWHLATNHLRATADDSGSSGCPRYDKMHHRLSEAQGRLATPEAIDLLAEVAQGGTQWSIVYGMSTGQVDVIMGRKYGEVHVFHLDVAGS